MLPDGTGYKKGVVVNSDKKIRDATRKAIFQTLKDIILSQKEEMAQRWFATNYHTLPFIQKCVLYAIQNADRENEDDFISTTAIVKSLKMNLDIGADMVQEALESLFCKKYLPALPDTLISGYNKAGKYSRYMVYHLSDTIRSACIQFPVPRPDNMKDAECYATGEARAHAILSLTEKIVTADQSVQFWLAILDNMKPDTIRKIAASEQSIRLLALLSDEDRRLVKFAFEAKEGCSAIAKKLFS